MQYAEAMARSTGLMGRIAGPGSDHRDPGPKKRNIQKTISRALELAVSNVRISVRRWGRKSIYPITSDEVEESAPEVLCRF